MICRYEDNVAKKNVKNVYGETVIALHDTFTWHDQKWIIIGFKGINVIIKLSGTSDVTIASEKLVSEIIEEHNLAYW